ncbi:alpha-amylase family glycosyl hydrolase [Paenibacillus tengchongensis]|uniref:alpha-amylase family glycosyl hydrolase n=1 Tax=Paenibacillus tengchongensis TaxID=2608684 RepID=UPI00124CAA3D|nr:alpha-amylase family glycosyl hydrolase [Paenibacillus tengchongensis]
MNLKHSPWSHSSLRKSAAALAATALLLAGCSGSGNHPDKETAQASDSVSAAPEVSVAASPAAASSPTQPALTVDEQPGTVYYEIFVRSFYDSDGDGIGDLRGVTQKLDYLNDGDPATTDDLGVGGIWLMPVNPSPSYHGYDVTDYRTINPDYGTLEDMKELIREAHKRGIKVIMDLVVNHTSKEHPWFVDAAKGGEHRDWYVWAEDSGRTPSGSSATGSGNPWHSVLGSHYLGVFWDGMPDLNFDQPEVRTEMKDIGKFWLELGLDGFRLDAAKHIYEDLLSDKSEATTDKNVAWWQEFRSSMNEINPEAYIVGEVWENSATAVGAYLDKAFDSGFNFGLAESLVNSAKTETNSGIAFTLERTYKLYSTISGGAFTDAIFLSNHDQNRVMSVLANNSDHAKTAAAMLLTLPGNPFIYYGEEIGMLGVKPDEGIREPMVWSADAASAGTATWEPGTNNAGNSGGDVASQSAEDDSLLSRYRQLIAARSEVEALNSGDIRDYALDNSGIMAFERISAKQQVLVVHNLSGQPQEIVLHSGSNNVTYSKVLKMIPGTAAVDAGKLTLGPYSSAILE